MNGGKNKNKPIIKIVFEPDNLPVVTQKSHGRIQENLNLPFKIPYPALNNISN
jgi:hypothetical protein